MTASLTISRTALSLSPLVISDTSDTFRLREDGFRRPAKTWRYERMPDSPFVHGSEIVGAALEESSLPVVLIVRGDTAEELEAALDELEAAVGQFSYSATQEIEGVERVWGCGPGDFVAAGDSGDAAAHLATVTLTIPVYPIPSLPEES